MSFGKGQVAPTLAGLQREGLAYRGFIYFGIMETTEGPHLLEYNVRLGDPETSVALPALSEPLLPQLVHCAAGELEGGDMAVSSDAFATVVLASRGYPFSWSTGFPIEGLEDLHPETLCFHAGTNYVEGRFCTAGGRVLNLVGRGRSVDTAVERAYCAANRVRFRGKMMRDDIGRGDT